MNAAPPALAQVQQWLQAALIQPASDAQGDMTAWLQASPRLPAEQRLAIYQRSYRARLRKCMEEQFPALRHALGATLFRDFVDEYLQACPSQSDSLHHLGDRLSDWLEHNRPDRDADTSEGESWIDFMIDLARFEHALFQLFDAPGDEDKVFADAHTPDPSLMLQRCVSLHEFRYPVAEYYNQVRSEQAPDFPTAQIAHYALVRRDYRIRVLPLTLPQHRFLSALCEGHAVTAALGMVAQSLQRPHEQLARAWAEPGSSRAGWIDAGLFIVRGQPA